MKQNCRSFASGHRVLPALHSMAPLSAFHNDSFRNVSGNNCAEIKKQTGAFCNESACRIMKQSLFVEIYNGSNFTSRNQNYISNLFFYQFDGLIITFCPLSLLCVTIWIPNSSRSGYNSNCRARHLRTCRVKQSRIPVWIASCFAPRSRRVACAAV
jgi:hypothetical protein